MRVAGQVVVDTSLPLKSSNCSRILSVIPVAVSIAEQPQFQIKGSNLSRSTRYLVVSLSIASFIRWCSWCAYDCSV